MMKLSKQIEEHNKEASTFGQMHNWILIEILKLEKEMERLEKEVLWHQNGSKGAMKIMMGSFKVPVKSKFLPWRKK